MIANNTFSKVNVACLCMSYADYCTIQDNNMNNVDCGVLLNGGMGCQVRRNLIVDSNTGIVLQEFSEMNAVYENTIKDCD